MVELAEEEDEPDTGTEAQEEAPAGARTAAM